MRTWPGAREHEFRTLLALADLRDGDVVCDVPAGGGYVEPYLQQRVDLTLVETSRVFYELCATRRRARAVLTTENVIPFGDQHFDCVLSLAGIHHNSNPDGFFRACARCLKPGGRLCVADVGVGSAVGRFLNEFVNRNGHQGHRGRFLGEHSLEAMRSAGLEIERSATVSYPWVFTSEEEMARFCALLFGIDRASTGAIVRGIESYLGFRAEQGLLLMNWELYFVRATKVRR